MRVWARVTVAMLAVSLVGQLSRILAFVDRRSLLSDVRARPGQVSLEDAERSDDLVRLAVVLALAMFLLATAVFIGWMFSCARLVAAHFRDALRHRPGWAIGGWFVPIGNFFLPARIAADLWRTEEQASGKRQRIVLIGAWWTFFLLSTVGARLFRPNRVSRTVEDLRAADLLQIRLATLSCVAAALAILVVQRTTGRVQRAVEVARSTSPDGH